MFNAAAHLQREATKRGLTMQEVIAAMDAGGPKIDALARQYFLYFGSPMWPPTKKVREYRRKCEQNYLNTLDNWLDWLAKRKEVLHD